MTVAEPQREVQLIRDCRCTAKAPYHQKEIANMRKSAILAGLAGASMMALTTGQALAFPGGTPSVAARITPEVQAVQYDGYRPRYDPTPYRSGGSHRNSRDGSPNSQSMRYFNGQWANGCFNLPYLSAVDACGGFGGRR
jgi:hypothetical protein